MYKKAHFDIKGSLEELPDEQSRRYCRNFPFIIMLRSSYNMNHIYIESYRSSEIPLIHLSVICTGRVIGP